MRILQVFNQQRAHAGGEEKMVNALVAALQSEGHDVEVYLASSRDIGDNVLSKVSAAASGFYSFSSYREIKDVIGRFRPEVVDVHNVYPLISPSVFAACSDGGVPSVFHVASQILSCPTWYHEYRGAICEKCVGGKEYWCVVQDCRANFVESTVYAARHAFARKSGQFKKVDLFIAMSRFMEEQLLRLGIPQEKIAYVPNMVQRQTPISTTTVEPYVAFAGRLSPEKGVGVLLDAARRLRHIQFKIAGDGPLRNGLEASAPANVEFTGLLDGDELSAFYADAYLLVMPSVTFESSGMSALEALAHEVPVVASRVGALPEVVLDDATGMLFEPGDVGQLSEIVAQLWQEPTRVARLGTAGRRLVEENHNQALFLARTIDAYQYAIDRVHSAAS